MEKMRLKSEVATTVATDSDGYLHIAQGGKEIRLSCAQVKKISESLRDGNGLALEADWNDGVAGAE